MVLIWIQCEKICGQHFIQNWKWNNLWSGIKIHLNAAKTGLWQNKTTLLNFLLERGGYAPDEKGNISAHFQERQGGGSRKLQATQPNSWLQKDCTEILQKVISRHIMTGWLGTAILDFLQMPCAWPTWQPSIEKRLGVWQGESRRFSSLP